MQLTIDYLKAAVRNILEEYGVKKAAIFGSLAAGEDSEDSDIDFLVEFEGGRSLLDLAGLKLALERILGRKVDIVTYRSLHPLLREKILSQQVVIL